MDEDTLMTTIEDNFEDTPEEVKDFMFGEEFESVLKEINTYLQNDIEKITLANTIKLFLLNVKSLDELSSYIDTLTTSNENKVLIKRIIQDKVINELLITIEVNEEMDKNAQDLDSAISTGAKITTPLASLSDRLKQASIATPAKRDYSLNRQVAGNGSIDHLAEAPSSASPTIDPYHEPVDNE